MQYLLPCRLCPSQPAPAALLPGWSGCCCRPCKWLGRRCSSASAASRYCWCELLESGPALHPGDLWSGTAPPLLPPHWCASQQTCDGAAVLPGTLSNAVQSCASQDQNVQFNKLLIRHPDCLIAARSCARSRQAGGSGSRVESARNTHPLQHRKCTTLNLPEWPSLSPDRPCTRLRDQCSPAAQ